jgi:inorganic pyrophosphatase
MLTFLRRAAFHTLDKGKAFDRFIYLLNDAGDKVSFWNDVPLKPKGSDPEIFNMIVEMPRYTLAKLELARDHKHHPIMHDLRQNIFNPEVTELRYYAQFGNWNYGLLP